MNAPAGPVPVLQQRVIAAGGELAYTMAGRGRPLLLIHGLGGTRQTWRHVVGPLARTHTVLAPDLPGHGESAPPAGDYSLGAHAAALRDLLVALGHTGATVVGHSLGGGIAMQFAYQFPDRTHRLALISSGGLGAELSPMLRAATLPGAAVITGGLGKLPVEFTRRALRVLSLVPGVVAGQDASLLAGELRELGAPSQRTAFVRTARNVIDWRGQTVTAARLLPLLTDIPVLAAWGTADETIPPRHHGEFARQLPHARTVAIPGAGHYPHETAPAELIPALQRFLKGTTAYRYDEARWRQLLTRSHDAGRSDSLSPALA